MEKSLETMKLKRLMLDKLPYGLFEVCGSFNLDAVELYCQFSRKGILMHSPGVDKNL